MYTSQYTHNSDQSKPRRDAKWIDRAQNQHLEFLKRAITKWSIILRAFLKIHVPCRGACYNHTLCILYCVINRIYNDIIMTILYNMVSTTSGEEDQ